MGSEFAQLKTDVETGEVINGEEIVFSPSVITRPLQVKDVEFPERLSAKENVEPLGRGPPKL